MAHTSDIRVRRSIDDLLADHNKNNTEPLDKLIRAWEGIQKLPPSDSNSFFNIAGYHGEPFRGAGWGNADWWGGYCNHGNVLFPTWHRAYVLRLEDALRSIEGCADVTLPYWNEVGLEALVNGVPWIFLEPEYTFSDKTKIKNPLHSYVFQKAIFDNLAQIPDANYSKPASYQTVRYPFSGLVGTEADSAKTEAYNRMLEAKGREETDRMLNENVSSWLNRSITNSDGKTILTHTSWKYRQCLLAENYTVFSNTTSATQWNQDKLGVKDAGLQCGLTVALESPHNDIHLAVGGFNLGNSNVDSPDAANANGDMGENNTASFDPIFFFHHCFIDKVFWTWQQIRGCTDKLEIIDKYPGTNSIDSQGPTPGVPGNAWLTMKSPLDPFVRGDGTPMTSEDVVNIETQLKYRYEAPQHSPLDRLSEISRQKPELQILLDKVSSPSLKFPDPIAGGEGEKPQLPPKQLPSSTPILEVYGVNRASVSGSFLLKVVDQDNQLLGVESILSRRNVSGCANCQTHLQVKTFVPLLGSTGDKNVRVEVQKREQIPPPGYRGPLEPLKPRFRFVHRPTASLPSR